MKFLKGIFHDPKLCQYCCNPKMGRTRDRENKLSKSLCNYATRMYSTAFSGSSAELSGESELQIGRQSQSPYIDSAPRSSLRCQSRVISMKIYEFQHLLEYSSGQRELKWWLRSWNCFHTDRTSRKKKKENRGKTVKTIKVITIPRQTRINLWSARSETIFN